MTRKKGASGKGAETESGWRQGGRRRMGVGGLPVGNRFVQQGTPGTGHSGAPTLARVIFSTFSRAFSGSVTQVR